MERRRALDLASARLVYGESSFGVRLKYCPSLPELQQCTSAL